MGVVIEICIKCPGGPTRIKGTDIDKATLGRAVRAPVRVPVTVPRHVHVLAMVAHRALGCVSPPALCCACVAKSTAALAQPRLNAAGHDV
jgi:hypothetical protein